MFEFKNRHRISEKSFSRERKLPFVTVLQLILLKSVKPLQNVLNEWTDNTNYTISASALSQARRKLKHTAFIELLQKCVLDVMYRIEDHERYKGKRLLGLDCSTLRLPNTEELRESFGVIKYMNGKQTQPSNQVEAQSCLLYDLLNEVPISGHLHPARTNDLKASVEELRCLKKDDLVIADRGFVSYRIFNTIMNQEADFVIRCKKGAFEKYHKLFGKTKVVEKTVLVKCPTARMKESMPESLKIRFVRVVLDTGEVEVLATSLLNKKEFPPSCFKELYRKRWGIETYFQTLKSRLSIDNFTGKSLEAVLQDFYATLFVSGLETIITGEANQELGEKETRYHQKVNKSISFHAIKNNIMLLTIDPPRNIDQRIKKLFLQNPTNVRTHRKKPPRRNSSTNNNRTSLYYQKYSRKHVF